jgi:aminoglycoside phosphotransferase (APT) family kinase protein
MTTATALTPTECARLCARLGDVLASASNLAVLAQHRIHGGASRETFSLDVGYDSPAGAKMIGLILRRDPPDSLIDTERTLEFAAYQSVQGSGAPAPEALLLETDPSVIGAPFFVMRRIEGGAAASPFQVEPYAPHGAAIGAQFFQHLGAIHAIDALNSPLAKVVAAPALNACWRRELDYWEGVIDADAQEPQPILRGAIRRLRREPPPAPARLAVVHGDYRNGNFLHDGQGKILAILDWEMAHMGDPLEDLAWALDPLWTAGRPDLAAGLIPQDQAIAAWRAASGLTFDASAFAWWSLFSSVKGMAIWLSSAKALADGKNTDPVLTFSGWYCAVRHNQIIAARLAAAPYGGLQ